MSSTGIEEKHTTTRPRRRKKPRAAKPETGNGGAPLDESQIAARMLAVLADPDLLAATTTEKTQKSGLSKDVWYRHRNSTKLRTKMARACMEALDEHTGSVLDALAESAQAPGRSGHQDRKLFLQLVGHEASVAAVKEKEVEAEEKQHTSAEFIDMFMEHHKGREHVLRYLLPPGYRRVMGLDPNVPRERLPDLQARLGLDSARCAEYVARIRASIASLPPNERGDPV